MFKGIDLYSDTATRPSPAMKRAMLEAPLGDEQQGEDPTTRLLEETMASQLGTSAALFFPSATMANQLAVKLHTEPGDEVIGAENCHIFNSEGGAASVHSGVQARMIDAPTGIFGPEHILAKYRNASGYHTPRSTLLLVENTTNAGGGYAWPLGQLHELLSCGQKLGLKTHLDGSRIFNAMVASGAGLKQLAQGFDTVTVCFSKGLSCAMGAVLAFDAAHYAKVRRLKQIFGGSMRQSGIMAAGCLYALEHHVSDLAADHERARVLACGLAAIRGIVVENTEPATNMIFFAIDPERGGDPDRFLDTCLRSGVRFSRFGPNRFRAVTHRDLGEGDIGQVLKIVGEIMASINMA